MRGSELVVVASTTEGDPIVTFYRSSPASQGIEIFTDFMYDRYKPADWTHERCTATVDITSLQGCP